MRLVKVFGSPWVIFIAALCVASPFLFQWCATRVLNSVTDDAYVQADMVEIAPQVDGEIVEMLVVDGDRVKAGQPLCRIDPTLFQRQVDIDKAQFALAEANLKVAQETLRYIADSVPKSVSLAAAQTTAAADLKIQDDLNVEYIREKVASGIQMATSEKDAAAASLDLAKELLEHRNKLGPSGAISREDWDEKKISAQEKTANLALAVSKIASATSGEKQVKMLEQKSKTADANVEIAKRNEDLSKSNFLKIDEQKAKVEQKAQAAAAAKAELDKSLAFLAYTEIKASFDGYVGKRFQFKGDFATKGTAVFSMYRWDDVYIAANLEETKLRGVAVGNEAVIEVDAFSKPFKGAVYLIGRATESKFSLIPRNISSGEFTRVIERVEVRMRVAKDDPRLGKLRPGLSAYVYISHKRDQNADTAAE